MIARLSALYQPAKELTGCIAPRRADASAPLAAAAMAARYRPTRRNKGWPVLLAVLVTSACSGNDLIPARNKAARFAAEAGWRYSLTDGGAFVVATALSPRPAQQTLTVYLEGDGLAFLGSRRISPDPTPSTPIALQMALNHADGAAAYVARPCQYTLAAGQGKNCHPRYWTSHRYAPEVIDSIAQVVNGLKHSANASRLVLVGYSGGGTVAALLASQRDDVAGLVTIAANLDVKYWVSRERLAPLDGSLDPADFVRTLRAIPQIHLTGSDDDVVPADVIASYLGKLGNGTAARSLRIQGFSHVCCWVEKWPELQHMTDLSTIMRAKNQ